MYVEVRRGLTRREGWWVGASVVDNSRMGHWALSTSSIENSGIIYASSLHLAMRALFSKKPPGRNWAGRNSWEHWREARFQTDQVSHNLASITLAKNWDLRFQEKQEDAQLRSFVRLLILVEFGLDNIYSRYDIEEEKSRT